MVDNSLNKKFFTNTYITGSGRQNYLKINHLEDPLFTSFTIDIDFYTSPLFYTINYSDYGYPNVEGMSDNIESALKYMYGKDIFVDEGYDILPVMSAGVLGENKMGFGIQQNVYMDKSLYGAVEYIYMVDKRNSGGDQNDVKFDGNDFVEYAGEPNSNNSYKLGDSVKDIVNESDRAWGERKIKQNEEQISICDEIMRESASTHSENEAILNSLLTECNSVKGRVDGESGELSEAQLMQKVDEYEKSQKSFEQLKLKIIEWANGEISQYQNKGSNIYMSNKCVQKIVSYDDISSDEKKNELKKIYGENFINEYIYGGDNSYLNKFEKLYTEMVKNFLNINAERGDIKSEKIINKFGNELKYFELYNEDGSIKGNVQAIAMKEQPEWVNKVNNVILSFGGKKENIEKIKTLMSFQCDRELSFVGFESSKIGNNNNILDNYKNALEDVRFKLYGDENGTVCDKSNPTPDSLYGRYLEAKEKYENDDYSQADKAKSLAQSGNSETMQMISKYEHLQSENNKKFDVYIQNDTQPLEANKKKFKSVPQTVLDMIGFISGMKKMTMDYPYIIQGVTGLDIAYNKHYGIKDPYLGSGDDKITLTCLESLDLRVSSMFNRYFNAIYDRQYRRERVPVNLRRFNCSIYVHDVRNFLSRVRLDKNGKQKFTYNRLLELTDMYYSVIEFKFYDCEIVPEETGNIFNDISNESPSEMKKTNFTFTYGNCVVNFVPQSEVAAYDNDIVYSDGEK